MLGVVSQALASDLLSQATELVKQAGLPCHQRFHMCRQVILACLERGQQCLSAKDKDAKSLLDHAYQLITEHLVSTSDQPAHTSGTPTSRICMKQYGPRASHSQVAALTAG